MLEERIGQEAVSKPARLSGACNHYTKEDIKWVVSQFRVPEDVRVAPFPGRGNINIHTFEVVAGGRQYLLQKVNSDVFTMPYRVLKAMVASIEAQRTALDNGCGVEDWEPIELIPTRDGHEFLDLTDEHGWSVWRLMVRITDVSSYKCLEEIPTRAGQLKLAQEVGRGLAIYSDLTSSIDPSTIEGSLLGYRDTSLYYREFHSVMAGNRDLSAAAPFMPEDPIVRAGTERHFLVSLPKKEYLSRRNDPELLPYLRLVQEQEPFAMGLWRALDEGRIRHTLIHGDTKIENFLFNPHTGRVKALVDLDTIMPFTWLADWGDMVRSMSNVAGENERDLDRVQVDTEVYEAVAKGFLGASSCVTDQEVELMTPSVQAIALELGLRFLTDYLRGDTYFQRCPGDPADINKVRAMVQLTLYKRLVEIGPETKRRISALRRPSSAAVML